MSAVGELFSQKRKAKKISLAKVSHDLLVKQEHLDAIEKGQWANLPEPTFAKGFIKIYAQYLGLDTSKILPLYRREYDETKYPHKQSPLQIKKRLMITPNKFALLLFIVTIAIFASYLLIQYFSILSAPKLEFISPPDDLTTSVPAITIDGRSEKEAMVSVNGQFIPIDDQGKFSYQYKLTQDKNTIEIIASKRLSPKSKVTRLVRLSK